MADAIGLCSRLLFSYATRCCRHIMPALRHISPSFIVALSMPVPPDIEEHAFIRAIRCLLPCHADGYTLRHYNMIRLDMLVIFAL